MKTFEEAMVKFRDGTNDDRAPYMGIVREARQSEIAKDLLLEVVRAALAEGDPASALWMAFCTGLMVGIEIEKADEVEGATK